MKECQLQEGDKVMLPGGEVYEFIKQDGMYCIWKTEHNPWTIASFGNNELEKHEDGYYKLPLN